MFRLLILVAIQTAFLAGGQVLLKLAMAQLPKFSWSWSYFKAVATDWWLLACGISFGVATVLWLYILMLVGFSTAYPLKALGYIFGMFAGIIVFGESVPIARWIGVVLIVAGCMFIMR